MLLRELGGSHLVREVDEHGDGNDLWVEARHQADLAFQPYVDESHVVLAAARLIGNRIAWQALCASVGESWPAGRQWWRPRGRRSAARRAGRRLLHDAHTRAVRFEVARGWPDESRAKTERPEFRDELASGPC